MDELRESAEALQKVFQWGKEHFVRENKTDAPTLLTFSQDGDAVITELEKYGNYPTRKRGCLKFADVKSFSNYVKFHAQGGTVIQGFYGTTDTLATINGNDCDTPGWCDFGARLELVRSPEWIEWTSHNGKPFTQVEFADFIEDQAHIVEEPEPARLIEVALNLRENKDVRFESKINVANGAYSLVFTESINDPTKGTFKVPTEFTICLRPFRGAQPVQMLVRLRYRVSSEGKASFFYKLDRADRVLESALEDIWKGVEEGTGLPVLRAP
jgi:uncharacterized protein YfdQ (DUF2303 family)